MKGAGARAKKIPWHPTDDETLKRLRSSGMLIRDISIEMGRSSSSIEGRLHKITRNKTQWKEGSRQQWQVRHDNELMELSKTGKGPTEIATMVGRSKGAVAQRLTYLGIHLFKKGSPNGMASGSTELLSFIWNNRIKPHLNPVTSGCWEWSRRNVKGGYGVVYVAKHAHLTHRIALGIKLGRFLDKNEQSLHKCDNPRCNNPNHLFVGTHQINMTDMAKKDRSASKLSKLEVESIRIAIGAGGTLASIAKQFGVSVSMISMIASKRRRIHI